MRLNRVYFDGTLADRRHCDLTGSAANHVARVLRLGGGDPLILFDGRGGEYTGTVEASGKDRVRVALGDHSALERESKLALTLAQGIARAERMDLIVQKATELGVARIVPIVAARSVVRTDAKQAERKLEHWRSIAIAACEQCGRNRLPVIDAPATLVAWLATRGAGDASLILSPRGAQPLRDLAAGAQSIVLLIGPEGGLSAEEEASALAGGFRAASLGPRILRTETAAIAALAALQTAAGDF
ncbi:MAG: 16S rRNA (uracil(1498)-N(3))-methyltransferase [Steroidobacteraceae bacterium]